MREQDGGSGSIDVQISSLSALARALRAEADQNLQPQVRHVADTLDPGVDPVRAVPGFAEWEAARAAYIDGRDGSVALLDRCRAATRILAEVAEEIAKRYRESDQFAKATLDDVHKAFEDVYRKHGQLDGSGAW